jgi:hypothetical protein
VFDGKRGDKRREANEPQRRGERGQEREYGEVRREPRWWNGKRPGCRESFLELVDQATDTVFQDWDVEIDE